VIFDFPSASPRLTELAYSLEVVNRFHWNLTIEHEHGELCLRTHELLVGRFGSEDELAVFVAGMAFALSENPASGG
jgi:hypothetical protein